MFSLITQTWETYLNMGKENFNGLLSWPHFTPRQSFIQFI